MNKILEEINFLKQYINYENYITEDEKNKIKKLTAKINIAKNKQYDKDKHKGKPKLLAWAIPAFVLAIAMSMWIYLPASSYTPFSIRGAGGGGGAGVTTGGGSRPASQLSAGVRSRASAARLAWCLRSFAPPSLRAPSEALPRGRSPPGEPHPYIQNK